LLGYEASRAICPEHRPATVQRPASAAAVFDIVTRFTHQTMKTLLTIPSCSSLGSSGRRGCCPLLRLAALPTRLREAEAC